MKWSRCGLLLVCAAAAADAATPPAPAANATAHEVLVVGGAYAAEPAAGDGPAPGAQWITAAALEALHAHGLGEALAQLGDGVAISDTAGSPFQPDVSVRGFAASPVLGTPQGISVYVDGVRVNEAFGDTVNWDLIPLAAIARLELVPGSDSAFGLNSLGGAIAISTRRGFDAPGTALDGERGSFDRQAAGFASGGHRAGLDWFVTGTLYDDPGWAAHDPGRMHQGFAELGYRDKLTDAALTLTWDDNRYAGNQALPRSLLSDPRQPYTWPDVQTNQLVFVAFNVGRTLVPDWRLQSTAWYRELASSSTNSNVNGNYDPASPLGPGNQPTGNAINRIGQYRAGLALRLEGDAHAWGLHHRLSAGITFDSGTSSLRQLTQEAGTSRDTSSAAPALLVTSLAAAARYAEIHAADGLRLSDQLLLSLALRHDRAALRLSDRIGTALDGEHSFASTRRSARIDYRPAKRIGLYASHSEGLRVPTPVELACADPGAPCSLPTGFAADPALRAVRSTTHEVGARGEPGGGVTLEIAAFRATLDDDIEFISAGGTTSAGYFHNVGRTRHQGFGIGAEATTGPFELRARYDRLEASFATALRLPSPWNSTAAPLSCPGCTDIAVAPDDELPGEPRHLLKLRLDWTRAAAALGLNLAAQSAQFARGDENNRDRHGAVPGFTVLGLDGRLQLAPRWRAWVRIDNLLDRRYSTFGVLGRNEFTGPGNSFDLGGASWRSEQFRSVAAPRALAVGLEWRLDPTRR